MRRLVVTTLLGGSLIGAGLTAPALAATDYGSLSAASTVIKPGCQDYSYSYRVNPPPNMDWDLFVYVKDPNGTNVGGGLLESGADGTSGSVAYELCSAQTLPGTYTLHGVLDYTNYGQAAPTEVVLPDAHFTLSAPARTTGLGATQHKKHAHHKKHKKRHHKKHRKAHHTALTLPPAPSSL